MGCEATKSSGEICGAKSAQKQPDGRYLCGRHTGGLLRAYQEGQKRRMALGLPVERSGGRGRYKAPDESIPAPEIDCPPASELLADADITTGEGRITYRSNLIRLLSSGRISTKEYDSLLRAAYDQAKDKSSGDQRGRKSINFRSVRTKQDVTNFEIEQEALERVQ